MIYDKDPNQINAQESGAADKAALPNAIEPSHASLLLRKNRHLSGLMCPPSQPQPMQGPIEKSGI